MKKINLWEDYKNWRQHCRMVDLSCEISPETKRFGALPSLELKTLYTVKEHGFALHIHSLPGQYGTHVDVPLHFVEGGRSLEAFEPENFILPLCVIDKSAEVAVNPDFVMRAEHIEAWEKEHGQVPAGSFAAFRSDWHKRHAGSADMNNIGPDRLAHVPGWGHSALELLIEKRKVAAIGHETFDTDASCENRDFTFKEERYVLQQDIFQVEVMVNLDQCPPTGSLIFCGVPKIRGSGGFPARCIAVCPK